MPGALPHQPFCPKRHCLVCFAVLVAGSWYVQDTGLWPNAEFQFSNFSGFQSNLIMATKMASWQVDGSGCASHLPPSRPGLPMPLCPVSESGSTDLWSQTALSEVVLGVSRLSKRRSVFIHWLSIGVLTCIDLTFLPFAFWMHVYTFAWAPSVHRCILKW